MFWYLIAKFLSQPKIVDWLIVRAVRRPYTHIQSRDGITVYMYRYWLFNPYMLSIVKEALKQAGKKIPWSFPISIRLHHIMVPDRDCHLHDHPWNARTIVLWGWYHEIRLATKTLKADRFYVRTAGDTATLKFGEYHKITQVSRGGVWTLFITYKYRGTWGYLVDGVKVPFYEYNKEELPEV